MPYPNEHAARVHDPGQYDSFARKNIAPGVDVILGIKNGKSEVQAYRFKKGRFTVAEARAWLKEHDIEYSSFEAASDRESSSEIPHGTRMFNASLEIPKFMPTPDGGFLVKDVVLLAVGNWTDSYVGTPLFYPEKVLEKDAKNWVARGIWARHAGGSPRTITDKVGEVRNEHYAVVPNIGGAVLGDLYYHRKTQMSRDITTLIEEGLIDAVSVEVGTRDIWNAEAKRYEAASLMFYGVANVDRGACEVCKIKRNESDASDCLPEGGPQKEESGMETKELEAKLADLESKQKELEKTNTDLSEQIKASKADTETKSKLLEESSKRIEDLTKQLAEAQAKVKELSSAPAPRTLVSSEIGTEDQPEPPRVIVENGMVYYA